MNEALKNAIAIHGKIRPLHKAKIAHHLAQTELNRKHPEPMTLIHKREKDLPDLPYRRPEVTQGLAQRAAGTMADWDNSDPFAYGRAHLHVMQGYVSPKDLIEEMGKRTHARRLAKIREIEDAKGN